MKSYLAQLSRLPYVFTDFNATWRPDVYPLCFAESEKDLRAGACTLGTEVALTDGELVVLAKVEADPEQVTKCWWARPVGEWVERGDVDELREAKSA